MNIFNENVFKSSKTSHLNPNPNPNSNQNRLKSVSDLCGTDEIELLLEEIKDLEPVNYRVDDIQDFEIAGSQTGAKSALGDCTGRCECGRVSPMGTINSWDSHSNYQHLIPVSKSNKKMITMYFDYSKIVSTTGIIRILLLISSIICLLFLCTSGTAKVSLFMLPLIGRVRFMLFVSLLTSSTMVLLLFLDITHLITLFPFDWTKVYTAIYAVLCVMFSVSSTLIFHTIFYSEAYSWVPKWTHRQLLITACFAVICFIELILLIVYENCNISKYKKVTDECKNGVQMEPMKQSLIRKTVPCPNSSNNKYIAITSYQKIDSVTFKRQDNFRVGSNTIKDPNHQPSTSTQNFK